MGISPLISFYQGGKDAEGRTLEQILSWDHDRLEYTHDYIQWIFPLMEMSRAQPGAPVLTRSDVEAFRRDSILEARMIDALRMMLRFFGLSLEGDHVPLVARRDDFESRESDWVTPGNHNLLRLTRILRSLRTVGLEFHAYAVFDALTGIHRERAEIIGPVTLAHWKNAMTDPEIA